MNNMSNNKKWSGSLNMETVILPVGSFEAHGAHLPLTTDTKIPDMIAEDVAKRLDLLVLPAIPYGITHELSNFKGTVSIDAECLVKITKDILESVIEHGAEKIIILNGHVGNEYSLNVAAMDVIAKSDKKIRIIVVNVWGGLIKLYPAHAGKEETSVMLHLLPESVDLENAVNQPISEEADNPYMAKHYFNKRKIPSEGESQNASKELGEKLFREAVDALIELIKK